MACGGGGGLVLLYFSLSGSWLFNDDAWWDIIAYVTGCSMILNAIGMQWKESVGKDIRQSAHSDFHSKSFIINFMANSGPSRLFSYRSQGQINMTEQFLMDTLPYNDRISIYSKLYSAAKNMYQLHGPWPPPALQTVLASSYTRHVLLPVCTIYMICRSIIHTMYRVCCYIIYTI